MQDTSQPLNPIHLLLIWIIFSLVYWWAAYIKPVHVDEFYSWVYPEQLTVTEILSRADGGIGHPPFYHLVQKGVQAISPVTNHLILRTANYFFGSIFILLMGFLLMRQGAPLLLLIGVCFSAAVLDAFILSRMWGLVCLFSVLLLIQGEHYIEKRGAFNLILVILITLAGLFADYNYILLAPYAAMVIFGRYPKFRFLVLSSTIFLALAWFSSTFMQMVKHNESGIFYFREVVHSLSKIPHEMGNMFFGLFYEELFVIAVVALTGLWIYLSQRDESTQTTERFRYVMIIVISLAGLALVSTVIGHTALRVRHLFPISLGLTAVIIWFGRHFHITDVRQRNNRILMTIILGSLVILAVSPIFWRDLRDQRFMLIFFPLLLSFLADNCNKNVLRAFGIVFIISGVIYLTSYRVSGYYPPPEVGVEPATIYENEAGFSTQYFSLDQEKLYYEVPYFFDIYNFDDNCRVCRMGTNDVPYWNLDDVRVVCRFDFDPYQHGLPNEYELVSRVVSLSPVDRVLFKLLTPTVHGKFAGRYEIRMYQKP